MQYVIPVRVPRCWKKLVDTAFVDNDDGDICYRETEDGPLFVVCSEKTNHLGNADPKPHYDDYRVD